MIWPAAALAVFLVGFAVVYGSVVQARVEAGFASRHEDAGATTDS